MTTADQMGKLLSAVATLTDEVTGLKTEVFGLKREVSETREIVEAWGAVKTAGKFLKWLAMIVASVTAIVVGAKLGIQHVFGRFP